MQAMLSDNGGSRTQTTLSDSGDETNGEASCVQAMPSSGGGRVNSAHIKLSDSGEVNGMQATPSNGDAKRTQATLSGSDGNVNTMQLGEATHTLLSEAMCMP